MYSFQFSSHLYSSPSCIGEGGTTDENFDNLTVDDIVCSYHPSPSVFKETHISVVRPDERNRFGF